MIKSGRSVRGFWTKPRFKCQSKWAHTTEETEKRPGTNLWSFLPSGAWNTKWSTSGIVHKPIYQDGLALLCALHSFNETKALTANALPLPVTHNKALNQTVSKVACWRGIPKMCQKWFQRFLKLKDRLRKGKRNSNPIVTQRKLSWNEEALFQQINKKTKRKGVWRFIALQFWM